MSSDPPEDPRAEPPRKRMVRAPTRGDAKGRNQAARLKTADTRSMSSQKWLNRQINDPFVKAAKARGSSRRAGGTQRSTSRAASARTSESSATRRA